MGIEKNQHDAGKKYTLGKVILSISGRNFLLLVLALLRLVEFCSCKMASARSRNCRLLCLNSVVSLLALVVYPGN